jgi:hypothetical protein
MAHIYISEMSLSAFTVALANQTVISNTSTIELDQKSLVYVISLLPYDTNGTLVGGNFLNPIRSADSIVIIETIKLVGGLTGKVYFFK